MEIIPISAATLITWNALGESLLFTIGYRPWSRIFYSVFLTSSVNLRNISSYNLCPYGQFKSRPLECISYLSDGKSLFSILAVVMTKYWEVSPISLVPALICRSSGRVRTESVCSSVTHKYLFVLIPTSTFTPCEILAQKAGLVLIRNRDLISHLPASETD